MNVIVETLPVDHAPYLYLGRGTIFHLRKHGSRVLICSTLRRAQASWIDLTCQGYSIEQNIAQLEQRLLEPVQAFDRLQHLVTHVLIQRCPQTWHREVAPFVFASAILAAYFAFKSEES